MDISPFGGAGSGWGLAAIGGGSGTLDWLSGLTRVVLVWVLSSPFLIIGVTLVLPKKNVWRFLAPDGIVQIRALLMGMVRRYRMA